MDGRKKYNWVLFRVLGRSATRLMPTPPERLDRMKMKIWDWIQSEIPEWEG